MKLLKNYRYSFVWAIVIIIASAIPGNDLERVTFFNIPYFDKMVHFGMYFVFTWILSNDFSKIYPSESNPAHPRLLAFIYAIIFGGTIELMQEYLFVNRSAEIADLLSNATGSLTAIIILWIRTKRKIKST